MDEKLKRFLQSTELFGRMPEAALNAIGASASVVRVANGAIVFEQGMKVETLFLVYSGGIEVKRRDTLTNVDFLLAAYGPGKSIGEESVFGDTIAQVTATASGETHLVTLPRAVVQQAAASSPELALAAAGILARRSARFVTEKGVRFISLSRIEPKREVVAQLPTRLMTEYHVVPVAQVGNTLTVAMVNPYDLLAMDAVRRAVNGLNVEPVGITQADFERFLRLHRAEAGEAPAAELNTLPPMPKRQHGLRFLQEGLDNINEGERRGEVAGEQVIQYLDGILGDAFTVDASDIHVEPSQTEISVRYRIDGRLMLRRERIPMRFHAAIVNRLKALASMDITERRKPQDGRLGVLSGNREMSLRISTVPTRFGENLVIRVLDRSAALMSLDRIVLVPSVRDMVRGLLFEKHGIVLVTGPTGSGKTTTMYSSILERMDEGVNIVTIEDPVEYTIPGITQVQYNEGVNLTYAEAVRAFLRQDTDVMLIGETRDARTAHNAIQAALSGHLVVSSLHTNSALGTVYRLREMGIEPFLIANALVGVVAQRLVRTICPDCREPHTHSTVLVERIFGAGQSPQLYHGSGCSSCNGTGFRGRTAVLEVLGVTEALRAGIVAGASMAELREIAVSSGMVEFRTYARHLLVRGITTPQEVIQSLTVDDAWQAHADGQLSCGACGASNTPNNSFCEECGAPLTES